MISPKLEARAAQRYKELMELIEAVPDHHIRATLYGVMDGQGERDNLTNTPEDLRGDYRRAWLIGKFAITMMKEFLEIEPEFFTEVVAEVQRNDKG